MRIVHAKIILDGWSIVHAKIIPSIRTGEMVSIFTGYTYTEQHKHCPNTLATLIERIADKFILPFWGWHVGLAVSGVGANRRVIWWTGTSGIPKPMDNQMRHYGLWYFTRDCLRVNMIFAVSLPQVVYMLMYGNDLRHGDLAHVIRWASLRFRE